jgi:dihydroneopterin aldolase
MTTRFAVPRTSAEMALATGLGRARRIFLKNFETRLSIGIHDFEKKARQRVIVNVDLYLDPDAKVERDHIDETVDYDFVRREIVGLAENSHFNLQETFCEKVLAICLARPGVLAARVSSEKLDVYPDCESVGFEIFRTR